MNPGEAFFWGVIVIMLLLAALACADAYRVSRRARLYREKAERRSW